MGKGAAKKTTTTADMQQALEVYAAKQRFFASALNMSWQLALGIVIPVVAGVKLDEYFDSAPSLTLTGFFLATAMGVMVVWNTVQGVNKLQADDEKRRLLRLRRRKRKRAK